MAGQPPINPGNDPKGSGDDVRTAATQILSSPQAANISATPPSAVPAQPKGPPDAPPDRVELRITEQNAKTIMDQFLNMMAQSSDVEGGGGSMRATDLHINPGRPPDFRVERVIRSLKASKLSNEDVVLLTNSIMNENQRARFERNHCIDMSYNLGKVRFRINTVQSFTGRSVSIRRFDEIKDFSSYNLPPNYIQIAEMERGFVMMTGSTGSGKTTSIAAMLDHVNRSFHKKIVTIEDPIEYVYTPKKSIIVQIEIGEDGVPSEDIALRNLVRMDPDAGLAGEMRDRQSLEAGLKTAQAGHLIFGTLHCEGVGQCFDRILAYYDTVEQQRILGTLADNVGAIINQRLLPSIKPDVGVVPAYEIFIPTPLTRRYIRELRYTEAVSEMEKPAMREIGCVTYVDSLHKLVTEEWVDYHTALDQAGDKAEKLKARLKGIDMK